MRKENRVSGKLSHCISVCKVSFLAVLTLCCYGPASAATGEAVITDYDYEIVATYPHDPKAFTQGLCFADGVLYEGTGLYGSSALRRMTPEGDEAEIRLLPKNLFGEGVTVFRDRVIQLTWKSGTGIVWDKNDLRVIRIFNYQTKEGWGITHNNQWLIMSDGSATLYFLDPDSFEVRRRLTVTGENGPVTRLNELEYIKGEIWANIWKKNRIARINEENGRVVGWLDLSEVVSLASPEQGEENVLNGIAYDSEKDRIFVTGKRWDKLYEIKVKAKKDSH